MTGLRYPYIWWWDGEYRPELAIGLIGVMAGVQIERHSFNSKLGMWVVRVNDWDMLAHAVVDDFGTLVQVR